jgi:signal transduction histidine kinase
MRGAAVVYTSYVLRLSAEPRQLLKLKDSLAQRFLLVAFGVLLLGMFAIGTWVTRKIESGVTQVAAATAALYINSVVAPHLQRRSSNDILSEPEIEALNQVLERPSVRSRVAAIKVWNKNGLVIYSTDKNLIGKEFLLNPYLPLAWDGIVAVKFDDLYDDDDPKALNGDQPLLQVYMPIRKAESGEIFAVVEVHERAEALSEQLSEADWHTWMVTALITASMMAALFSIVADGSKTIEQQRAALTKQVSQLSHLLNQNQLMRRLGYDLHDGIAQLIGLALLRLDRLKLTKRDRDNGSKIQKALSDAVTDIRNLCRGLLLPEIQDLTLGAALQFMARHHEQKTGTKVHCDIAELPEDAPQFVKLSLCRFVQEGLNNAFRHAGGKGQRVSASWDDRTITIKVSDEGPGMSVPSRATNNVRLGLMGLWDRIESVGGLMTVESIAGEGTCLTACLPLSTGESDGK